MFEWRFASYRTTFIARFGDSFPRSSLRDPLHMKRAIIHCLLSRQAYIPGRFSRSVAQLVAQIRLQDFCAISILWVSAYA
jgi:hypothetical protein